MISDEISVAIFRLMFRVRGTDQQQRDLPSPHAATSLADPSTAAAANFVAHFDVDLRPLERIDVVEDGYLPQQDLPDDVGGLDRLGEYRRRASAAGGQPL